MKVIERLKILRSQSKMTQTEFGNAVGMSQGNVSEMERGKFNPSIETIISACKYFRVSADWLLMGTSYDPNIPKNVDIFCESTPEGGYRPNRSTGLPATEASEPDDEVLKSNGQGNNTDRSQKLAVDCDPELKQMVDVLKKLLQSNDPNLRGWAIIQFRRAFAEYCAGSEAKGSRS
jgi:transcriptional regulator with XRE-family HTH domain